MKINDTYLPFHPASPLVTFDTTDTRSSHILFHITRYYTPSISKHSSTEPLFTVMESNLSPLSQTFKINYCLLHTCFDECAKTIPSNTNTLHKPTDLYCVDLMKQTLLSDACPSDGLCGTYQ